MKHVHLPESRSDWEEELIRTYSPRLAVLERRGPSETLRKFNIYLHVVKGYARRTGIKPDINNVLELFREYF